MNALIVKIRVALTTAILSLTFLSAPGFAQTVPEALLDDLGLPFSRTGDAARVQALQVDLSWIGLYAGQITGSRTLELNEAVRLFQAGLREESTAPLTTKQREILKQRAADTREGADFVTVSQKWTGTQLKLPFGFVVQPEVWGEHDEHLTFRGQDVSRLRINIEANAFSRSKSHWKNGLEKRVSIEGMRLLAISDQGSFVGAVTYDPESSRREYTIIADQGVRSALLAISLQEASVPSMRPLIGEVISSFKPFNSTALTHGQIRRRVNNGDLPGRDRQGWLRTMIGNGSGSIVSVDGHVLTNHHVVEGCARISVFGRDAVLVGTEVRTDLALVLVPDLAGRDPVRFSDRLAPLGSEVFVMGYPKFLITQSLNITQGIVSSTVGLFGDKRHMQISAAVQSGNSGGPVLADDGTQIGVVVSKPNTELTAAEDLENIAWIIRGTVAQEFLKRFGTYTVKQSRNTKAVPSDQRANEWRRFTVRIECHSE